MLNASSWSCWVLTRKSLLRRPMITNFYDSLGPGGWWHPVLIGSEQFPFCPLSEGPAISITQGSLGLSEWMWDGTMLLLMMIAGSGSLGSFSLSSNQPILRVARLVHHLRWRVHVVRRGSLSSHLSLLSSKLQGFSSFKYLHMHLLGGIGIKLKRWPMWGLIKTSVGT